jgi:hypothetical protein
MDETFTRQRGQRRNKSKRGDWCNWNKRAKGGKQDRKCDVAILESVNVLSLLNIVDPKFFIPSKSKSPI